MQQPVQDADTLFEQLLQDLPAEIIPMAKAFRAFTRARKIKTPQQLLRIVLLYCGLDSSLRHTAAVFTVLEERITDSSISERLLACEPWLKAILPTLLPRAPKQPDSTTLRFLIVDASTVEAPGTGGRLRLHLCLDLLTLEILQLRITSSKVGETLANFSFGQDHVVIADRSYATRNGIFRTLETTAHLMARASAHNLPLRTLAGEKFDVLAEVEKQEPETVRTFEVLVEADSGEQAHLWLHVYRLTGAAAEAARRRTRRKATKNGRTPKARTVNLAEYVLVVTSVPPEQISPEEVMQLYRARWQVEVVIKRFKSLLDVDLLRARASSPLASVWMHGKILYALTIERRARRLWGGDWTQYESTRRATAWRVYELVAREVLPLISASMFWKSEQRAACLHVLSERPRKRHLERLPDGARLVLDVHLQPAPITHKPAA